MRTCIELPDGYYLIFVLEDRRFVFVHIEVVGRGEDRHHSGKAFLFGLAGHSITAGRPSAKEKKEIDRLTQRAAPHAPGLSTAGYSAQGTRMLTDTCVFCVDTSSTT
jgi:hypothetical protein